LPGNLRGGAASEVVGAMIAKGLLAEVHADEGDPLWHGTAMAAG
jgi:hypothetical protein